MENLKHTKGEWFANNCTVTIQGTFDEIAKCHSLSNSNGLSLEEMRSNAKLIAAAPELLEALINMVKMYEEIEPAGGYQGYYELAKIAITKAIKP